MAEAVRRFREASGSDVVRRLIARPIRLDPPHMAPAMPVPRSFATPPFERAGDGFEAPVRDAAAVEGIAVGDDSFEDEDVVDRLQAEMAVMKAILMAERAEAESLRARIAQYAEPEPIGAEARATRDRWAGMVDRLLMSPR